MGLPQNPPDTHHSSDALSEEASDSGNEGSDKPRYEVRELGIIFIDFYKFLATLHYDVADLKCPPPIGWDTTIFPEYILGSKSEDVVELMRHLPYFKENEKSTHFHYKSKLIDYTDPEMHGNAQSEDEIVKDVHEEFLDSDGETVDHSHLLVIAAGYESGGRTFILDVRQGEITEDVIRWNTCAPVDAKEFFFRLKREYISLQLIPCPGRETQEAAQVPEPFRAISEQEVRAQTEEWYPGTHLDWQFVRQVYRHYGWPREFRRQEAIDFIDEFMERDKDRRGEWEPAFH